MPYGELIREAFRIAARHRYLWPFGLFAGGAFGFNFKVSNAYWTLAYLRLASPPPSERPY